MPGVQDGENALGELIDVDGLRQDALGADLHAPPEHGVGVVQDAAVEERVQAAEGRADAREGRAPGNRGRRARS